MKRKKAFFENGNFCKKFSFLEGYSGGLGVFFNKIPKLFDTIHPFSWPRTDFDFHEFTYDLKVFDCLMENFLQIMFAAFIQYC